ncbi:MAG: hypothetical protein ABI895_38925, partial [Deltaproteobacteria bacterium]
TARGDNEDVQSQGDPPRSAAQDHLAETLIKLAQHPIARPGVPSAHVHDVEADRDANFPP